MKCKNYLCTSNELYECKKGDVDCYGWMPFTNADMVRRMINRELIDMIYEWHNKLSRDDEYNYDVAEWLGQEAE